MFVREPMESWSTRRVTLMGDAAHGMLNFLGQGAAMAMEDGMVLARCLEASDGCSQAFSRYEAARMQRTREVQFESEARAARLQTHQPDKYSDESHRNDEDMGLFYYDAMTVPI